MKCELGRVKSERKVCARRTYFFTLHPSPFPIRKAITLIEILISMFVLLFGLMGVASIFPVGSHYMTEGEKFDFGSALTANAFEELQTRGMLNPENWLRSMMQQDLPELPDARKARFMTDYNLSAYDAAVITASREMADYYENTVHAAGGEPKLCANWVMVDLSGALNKENLEIVHSPVSPEMLGRMIGRIADNTISGKIAKQVFESMWNAEGDADAIIEARGLKQVTDTGAIETLVDEVIAANPKQVEQYRGGKDKLLGYFVGQVMKATRGKANPQQLNEILKRKLSG